MDSDLGSCDSPRTWYEDSDCDGYGAPSKTRRVCERAPGFVGNDTDCDDNDSAVHPDADEVCNGADDDCDGPTDEGLTRDCSKQKGVCSGATIACQKGRFPTCGAAEYGSNYEMTEQSCDDLDNDCDGTTDRLVGCNYRATISVNSVGTVQDLAVDAGSGDVYVVGTDGDWVPRGGGGYRRSGWVAKYDRAGN